jgi:prolyl 4-hydroxylase
MPEPDSFRQRAENLASNGDPRQAHALLEEAASADDPEGLFALGIWLDNGIWIERDRKRARQCFGRAAEAGHAQSDVIFTNFLGNGTGGARDWPQALVRLRARALHDERARFELELIDAMGLDAEGNAASLAQGETLSPSPTIRLHPGLLSEAECAYLAVAATPFFQPATVVDNVSGKAIRNPIRTSDTAILTPPLESLVIHAINRRLAAITGTSSECGEPLQVLRYRPGQEYKTHIDAIPALDNQRAWTALVYLNDAYEGGETRFVTAGGTVRGRTGTALVFRNVDADGRPDKRAAHCGLPVLSGTKLLASRWIRERPFVPPEPQRAS